MLRLRVADNPLRPRADLTFRRARRRSRSRASRTASPAAVVMDSTRLTQFGAWDGTLDGRRPSGSSRARAACSACATARGASARSASREGGAPGMPPQFFWLWAPIHFDDVCMHFDVNEDGDGRRWHANGNLGLRGRRRSATPRIRRARMTRRRAPHPAGQPGTRRARRRAITLTPHARRRASRSTLEPILTFQMLGLGYLAPGVGPRHVEGRGGGRRRRRGRSPTSPRSIRATCTCSSSAARAGATAKASACSSSS